MPDFLVISLYFACLLTSIASTTTTATFTKYMNRSQASFEISCHDKMSRQFLDNHYCIKDESVYEQYSQTPFANKVHDDCSCIMN